MKVTAQVTLDGRVLLISGRNIIELERTDDTRHVIELLQEAAEVQAQINGDETSCTTNTVPGVASR